MAMIQIPKPDMGITEFETHVLVAEHRHQNMMDRIGRIEASIDTIVEQIRTTKRTVIGAAITLAGGAASALFAILMAYFKHY